jgi:hypothetical protein
MLSTGISFIDATSFEVCLICGLIAYAHQPKKPTLAREALAALLS